jgi:lambda family phage portal protein
MSKKADALQLQIQGLKSEIRALRSFEGSKLGRRTDNWLAYSRGPNADLSFDLSRIIARSQDLVDSDPWAYKASCVVTNNWVGDGIIGAPVGASKRFADSWREWAEGTDCDWFGQHNFYGLQSLVARTVAVRGSCLIRRRLYEGNVAKGLNPLQLMVIEPDYLDRSKDDGANIRFGKEYDPETGKLKGYWIRRSHPGEYAWNQASVILSDFVDASEVCHVYDVRRPNQATGVPWGVSAILKLRDVSDRDAAQLMKDKLAACFMAFVTDADGDGTLDGNSIIDTLEPGLIEPLPPGKSVTFAEPPTAGDYVQTQKYHLLSIAQAYEITYESLTGDLGNVNFSSGRMGWMEMRRAVARWRWGIMIPQFLNPVARWFSDSAAVVGTGRVTSRFEWTPPVTWLVDPAREIPAYIKAVQAGFMSLSEIQRMLGYVPELVIKELGMDLEAARAIGLKLSTDLVTPGLH